MVETNNSETGISLGEIDDLSEKQTCTRNLQKDNITSIEGSEVCLESSKDILIRITVTWQETSQ